MTYNQLNVPAASQHPLVAEMTFRDLKESLQLGIKDFIAAPRFGIFFSAVYVLTGFILLMLGAGHLTWIFVLSLGFPIAAPFAAVGLYEVSRRLEKGAALNWSDILGVVWQERTRQVPWMGAIIMIYFMFWTFLAHMIFALFMGLSTLTNVTASFEVFLTPNGLTMIAVELAIGAIFAFLLFCLTAFSLPMLLDKELDFVTAMLISLQAVVQNWPVMIVWAVVIALSSLIALAPAFLGLFVVLPVLGHATWHLYRRALYDPK